MPWNTSINRNVNRTTQILAIDGVVLPRDMSDEVDEKEFRVTIMGVKIFFLCYGRNVLFTNLRYTRW